jgi:hypothetical protein
MPFSKGFRREVQCHWWGERVKNHRRTLDLWAATRNIPETTACRVEESQGVSMPLERPFVYVSKFPFYTNVCMLTLSFTLLPRLPLCWPVGQLRRGRKFKVLIYFSILILKLLIILVISTILVLPIS